MVVATVQKMHDDDTITKSFNTLYLLHCMNGVAIKKKKCHKMLVWKTKHAKLAYEIKML